jgi:hypothetical protein
MSVVLYPAEAAPPQGGQDPRAPRIAPRRRGRPWLPPAPGGIRVPARHDRVPSVLGRREVHRIAVRHLSPRRSMPRAWRHGSFASYPIATRAVFVLADQVHLPRPRTKRSSSVVRGTVVLKQTAAARQPAGGAVRGPPCRRSPPAETAKGDPGALRLWQIGIHRLQLPAQRGVGRIRPAVPADRLFFVAGRLVQVVTSGPVEADAVVIAEGRIDGGLTVEKPGGRPGRPAGSTRGRCGAA